MRLLLDTHTLLWTAEASTRLSRRASDAILNASNDIVVSAVSIYELEFKVATGRLDALPRSLRLVAAEAGFSELSIMPEHADRAARLPLIHRDPWDRIIAAQAIMESMTVVTRDPAIAALGAPTLW